MCLPLSLEACPSSWMAEPRSKIARLPWTVSNMIHRVNFSSCSIQVGGTGFTLTAADTVVFVELDWVPGILTQAEDRLHRIGQRRSVLVQHLVLDGSLDPNMVDTIIRNQKIVTAAL